MKKCNSRLLLVALFAAGAVWAAETTALTRAQWLKKIGEAVTQESVLRETIVQVSPEERVEFTQRVLKAVTRLPVSPDEKAAAFVRAAVACIAGATGEVKYKVIAEVFAGVPVEFLPLVTEELAKRFDQEYNKLTDAQYEVIAVAAVSAAVIRNAKTDEPSVRNTFVILAFLRGAKSPELEAKLLALLPDDRMRGLVASWLPAALKDRNYDGLLAAADVEALALSYETILRMVGHSSLDRLLAQMYYGDTFLREAGSTWYGPDSSVPDGTFDVGINRLPRTTGYQDQSTSIETIETSEGNCDACSICIRDLFK